MFYLFQLVYKFNSYADKWTHYKMIQVISVDLEEAKKIISDNYTNETILEFKLLKITPITSSFITTSMVISDYLYNQSGSSTVPV